MSQAVRRINPKNGETADDANLLGVGVCKGNWIAKDIHAFIKKHLTLSPYQKPYVFRPHLIPNFCTTFDLDFRFKEKTIIDNEEIIMYAQECCKFTKEVTGKDVEILLTRKEKLVYKKTDKTHGKYYASGCHFYFLKHRFTKSEATAIRQKMNKDVIKEKLNFKGIQHVIDDCVFPFGDTGVYMLCSPKPGQGLRHELVAQVKHDDYQELSMEGLLPKHIHQIFKKHIISDDCYISTNEVEVEEEKTQSGKIKKKKAWRYPPVENFVLNMESHWDFNLKFFFEICEGFQDQLGTMAKWKDVCYFLKETNIPTDILVDSLNNFYKPDNPNENYNLIGKNRVVRTSPQIYQREREKLWGHIKNIGLSPSYWELFFPQRFDTIQDIYALCGMNVVWECKTQHLDKFVQCFSEIQCFDMAKPMLHYKYRKVIGRYRTPNLQLRVSHSTNKFADKYVFYKEIEETKEGSKTVVKKVRLTKLIDDMMLLGQLHVYSGIVCEPYFKESKMNPTLLNIYEVPDLAFYKPSKKYDIKESVFWKHLTEIVCSGDSYKIEWLFTYCAMKIQQPERKVEKILTLVASTTGCGKSSFFHFLAALLGRGKSFEFTDIKQLNQKFNSHLSGKLIILVDDIDKLTKAQQDCLKTTCTQKNFKLEKKGIDSTLEKAYYDSILTSNNETDVWVESQDRRSELIYVSTRYKQNKENKWFWDQFYKDLQNMCLLSHFYKFFAEYPIKLDIRNKDVRFDQVVLQKQISQSLPRSHEFLRVLFETPDFIRLDNIDLCVFRNGIVWISAQMLYDLFGDWIKRVGSNCKPAKKRFMNDLKSIGIEPTRKRYERRRCRKIELSPKIIKEALSVHGDIEVLQSGLEETVKSWVENERIDGIIKSKEEREKLFPERENEFLEQDE